MPVITKALDDCIVLNKKIHVECKLSKTNGSRFFHIKNEAWSFLRFTPQESSGMWRSSIVHIQVSWACSRGRVRIEPHLGMSAGRHGQVLHTGLPAMILVFAK